MELNNYQKEIFNLQRPTIETYGKRAWGWSVFYLLWIGVGGYALYLQIAKGHKVTGMRDNVVWGLYIANFIFFIGISYAGAIISGFLHLLKVEWRKPIIRMTGRAAQLKYASGADQFCKQSPATIRPPWRASTSSPSGGVDSMR